MRVTGKSKNNKSRFWESISAVEFDSTLEMPKSGDPSQNAWLTLSINYTLNFVDRINPLPGLTVVQDGKWFAKDSNKVPVLFPIKDWDVNSRSEFVKKFAKGESFWNYKFVLVTPRDYDAFDFRTFRGPGWICRPNVICLFRLKNGGSPNHLAINVVRTGNKDFRSSMTNYDDQDVYVTTLWHELGHALEQLHIKALLGGNQKCLVDVNDDDCYDTPSGFEANVMGKGKGLLPQNAKAWHELIALHTETPPAKWTVSLATHMPPRKMPLGFDVRGVMPSQW